MADVWSTCEACGLEYMGAHRCQALEGADALKVAAWVLEDPFVEDDRLFDFSGAAFTAADCGALSAAFGAIAKRLRKVDHG